MKNLAFLCSLLATFFLFVSCEKDSLEEPIEGISAKTQLAKDNAKQTGFDQWGYNWNAHQFRGYLINAWFGDNLYPGAPWWKKEPPFEGDVIAYQEAHPEVLDYPFWIYGDMKMVSHWNESSISSEGEYPENILDTDAWITFHYSQGEGANKWSQFQKFVAAKSTDQLMVYYADDSGPVFGEWFSEEGESIGLYYLWPDRILIQVVNTGNIPEGFLATYKSPLFPGIGAFKSR